MSLVGGKFRFTVELAIDDKVDLGRQAVTLQVARHLETARLRNLGEAGQGTLDQPEIGRIAKKNGYDVVVDAQAVPYVRSDLDLTGQVIQMYNGGASGGDDKEEKKDDKKDEKKEAPKEAPKEEKKP